MPRKRAFSAPAGPAFDAPLSDLNITPLIDVMLVLLVMMILTLPTVLHKVPIDLPQGKAPPSETVTHPLVLARDGTVTLDGVGLSDAGMPARFKALDADPKYSTLLHLGFELWLQDTLAFRAGLRGSYFALITLAFAEVFRILANSASFTRGGLGMLIKADQRPINFQFKDPVWIYYIALGLCAISLLIAWWLTRSRFGARLVAIRENEDAARALGIEELRYVQTAVGFTRAPGEVLRVGIARTADAFLLIARGLVDVFGGLVTHPTTAPAASGPVGIAAIGTTLYVCDNVNHTISSVTAAGTVATLAGHGFGPIDYVTLCDAATLEPIHVLDRPARLLGAAKLGTTRLIDNIAVDPA